MNNSTFRILDPWVSRPPVLGVGALPDSLRAIVGEVEGQLDQQSALRYAYEVLSQRYRGYRMLTFLRLDRFWITDIEKLWRIQGFLHCNHMNYLLRTLLLASGKFSPEAIEAKWTQIWLFSPHQYLVITLENGERVEVDLWGRVYGIPFGSHAHGFQGGSFFAKIGE